MHIDLYFWLANTRLICMQGGVVIRKRKRKDSDQPTSSNKMKCKQQLKYGGFLQSSVIIVDGQVVNDNKQSEQKEESTGTATVEHVVNR